MTHIFERRLKIVILDSFYDAREDVQVRDFFAKVMQLKLKGYLHEYPHGTLPIDSSDFFCTHFTVCLQEGAGSTNLRPIMAFKSVGSDRCAHFNVSFPAITILGNGETPLKRRIRKMLDESAMNGSVIHYGSSWTIDPEVREDRSLTRLLRDYFIAMNTLHFERIAPATLMACGILRFKTEQFLGSLGYSPVVVPGGEGAFFKHAFLNLEPSVMVGAQDVSATAREIAERFRKSWNDRLELGGYLGDSVDILRKKAA